MGRTAQHISNKRVLTSEFAGDRLYSDLRRHVCSASANQAIASVRALAEQYGVSFGTVRRVVGRLTDEKLLYTVRGKGIFVSDRSAAGMEARRTILYVDDWSDTSHPYCVRKLRGVVEGAEGLGLRVQVHRCSSGGPRPEDRVVLDEAAREGVAGIMVTWLARPVYDELRRRNPAISVVASEQLLPERNVARVTEDQVSLGYQAGRYLCEAGVRTIAMVYKDAESYGGMAAALSEATRRVEAQYVKLDAGGDLGPIRDAIESLRPEGLAFMDDRAARQVLIALAARDPAWLSGVRVISHANAGEDFLPPEVARLEVDGYETGKAAVSALKALIDGGPSAQRIVRLPPRLVAPSASARQD